MGNIKVIKILLLTLFLTSCWVRIIAPYDPVTDEKISDLQETVITKFSEWEREIPGIETEYAFYDHTQAVLEILVSRNQQIEKSEILVQMLQKIQENMDILKELHEQDELSLEVIQQVKPDIMAQFNAIQKFQMALKKAEEE